MTGRNAAGELKVFIVTGEHSGDALAGPLMAALKRLHGGPIRFAGVGGERMAEEGLRSIFPLADVAVMGPLSILPRLPRLVRRVHQAVDEAVAFSPDVLVIVDAPEFTHPIAKRVRKRRPEVPIVDYVSPSVWAWRPGRARKMRPYVDHLLALLPFEPAAHERLGGPACSYVGHPLIERFAALGSTDPAPLAARLGIVRGAPVLVVLPGSRLSEVKRLMAPFGSAIGMLRERIGPLEVVIPTLPHVRAEVEQAAAAWPLRPHITEGEADKLAAFRLARAALAASGTVTLELALAGSPMVVAYRVDPLAARLRFLVKVPSIVLANLVLGENAFPELIQERCEPEALAAELAAVMADGPARQRQLAALARVPVLMAPPGPSPSETGAAIVLKTLGRNQP